MSLIEMLIATGILALLLATLFPALTLFSKIYAKTNYEADFQRSSAVCLEMLSMDARMAKSFTVADSGRKLTINMGNGATVVYAVTSAQRPYTLTRTSGANNMTVLSNVDQINFRTAGVDASIVALRATLKKQVVGGQYAEKVIESQFKRRL